MPAVSANTNAVTNTRPFGPSLPSSKSPVLTGPSGREIVDTHTRGDKTDVKAVASDLRQQIKERPQEATRLLMNALEHVKADDRDELAQEFVRVHSDGELKTLGQSEAGKGALALAVNELAKGSVHKDEANDAKRVGDALGVDIDVKVNTGWAKVSGIVHTVLDLAGFIPGLGAIPDLINAGIYAAEGDYENAALSAVAAVPLGGDAVKGTSMAVKGGKQLLEIGAEQTLKHGDEALDVVKAGAKASDDVVQTASRGLDGAVTRSQTAAAGAKRKAGDSVGDAALPPASKQKVSGAADNAAGALAKASKPAQDYADLIKSNKPWSWAQDFPGGASLTAGQKSKIRKEAIDAGLIPNVQYKPGTRFADFQAAGLVNRVDQLPTGLWKKGDKAQFDWLDSRIPGGRPDGYTWHHSDVPGRMELVPFGPHNIINHQGGRSSGMWADAPR